jgi:DNA-binding winged helix-turn-helix (wHTH) protein/TolB-like protein
MTDETDRSGRPINLADEADFHLGALLVSPSTREVGRGEIREMLEPRVMQVLVALFQADGRVVSRDELIARCWEGRIVGEDAINRAIGRLRRLSEEDREASFVIETIPRVGYRLIAGHPSASATSVSATDLAAAQPKTRTSTPILIAAAAIVVAAAAGALFWLIPRPAPAPASPAVARIAVLPFDVLNDSPQAHHFADALSDEIVTRLNSNRIQVVSRDTAATLRGADRDRKVAELGVALLLDGIVQDDGNSVKVSVHLDDPVKRVLLWSGSVDGPVTKSDQLEGSIADTIVAVLDCSSRALVPAHGLTDPELLTQYLHACDLLKNGTGSREGVYDVLASLRHVAAKAPGFAPIHSDFAKYAPLFWNGLPPDQAAALRREAYSEAQKALALDPKSPDAYLGLSQLLPPTDWAGREKLLRQGVAGDPDWPFTNGLLGLTLADTGRLQEAVAYVQKATASDVQIDFGSTNGILQCGSGRFEPMTSQLVDALKHEFRYSWVGYTLRRCLKYARRWAELHALAMTNGTQIEREDPRSSIYLVYLVAEESGKPADVARARSAALATPGSGRKDEIAPAVEALSALGLIDDAFIVANQHKPSRVGDTQFLFFTLTAPMRRDPRFMQLAARFGLVDYWRTTGHWPDFCADPTLPYKCRAEAEKLTAAK